MTAALRRQAVVLSAAAFLLGLLGVGGLLIALHRGLEPDPWNPLGDYPDQTFIGYDGNAVVVEGTKCNNSNEVVVVSGEFSWQRMEPRGALIGVGQGRATREPGCVTQRFTNDVPNVVRAADRPGALWRIVGTETPIDGRRIGIPRVYVTETFTLPPVP